MRIALTRTRPTDLFASGGIPALLARSHARYGDARMEGESGDGKAGDGGDGKGADSGAGAGKNDGKGGDGESDRGFPADTPVAEMTTAQQAAYWKYQARKHEQTAKSRSDYDDLKKKAGEADKLRKERENENEKAVREAAEKAAAEERAKSTPRLVLAEFRAAAAGRIAADRLATLTEDLDLSKYLTDKGEVDEDKVAKKVAAWAPKDDGKGSDTRRFPDLGQGRRDQSNTKGAGGAAEAARRFSKASTN